MVETYRATLKDNDVKNGTPISVTRLSRTLKSVVPFRHHLWRIYAALRGPKREANAEDDKHKEVYRDVEALEAVVSDRKIVIKGITLNIDPPRVIETVHEVLVRDDYSFGAESARYVMVDIGMNVGIASLSKAADSRFARIYAYEPVAPTYALALRNIELNPALRPKILPFNFGLSDHDEELAIRFTPDHIMSVSSEGTFDTCFSTNVTIERIQLKKASTVLEPIIVEHRRRNKERIFLKLDCEGAEFKILEDLDQSGLLGDIDVTVIEWHGKEPDPILRLLTKNGLLWFKSCINVRWNVGIIKAVRGADVR